MEFHLKNFTFSYITCMETTIPNNTQATLPDFDLEKYFAEDERKERERASRERFIHECGVREGRKQVLEEKEEELLAWAKYAAEIFIDVAIEFHIPVKIHQARVGFEPTSGVPTAFMMVSKSEIDVRRTQMQICRSIERALRAHCGADVKVWTYDRQTFDRESVIADYPLFRTQT